MPEVFLTGITGGSMSPPDELEIVCDEPVDGEPGHDDHHHARTSEVHRGKFGSNTSALVVQANGTEPFFIRFDAGTGAKRASAHVKKSGVKGTPYFFTHYHDDHVNGLKFDPLLYDPKDTEMIRGPRITDMSLFDRVNNVVLEPGTWPIKPPVAKMKEKFEIFDAGEVYKFKCSGGEVVVESFPLNHPKPAGSFCGSVGYKVISPNGKSFVLATDCEASTDEYAAMVAKHFDKADLAALDVQYKDSEFAGKKTLGGLRMSRETWGHSTPAMTRDIIGRCKTPPKRLLIVHHDSSRDMAGLAIFEHEMRQMLPGIQVDFAHEDFYSY